MLSQPPALAGLSPRAPRGATDLTLTQCVKRVLCAQLILTATLAALVFAAHGLSLSAASPALTSAAYGSALALLTTLLTARSVGKTSHPSLTSQTLLPVYVGVLHRLLIVASAITLGLVGGLQPHYIILGYASLQTAYVIATWPTKQR